MVVTQKYELRVSFKLKNFTLFDIENTVQEEKASTKLNP